MRAGDLQCGGYSLAIVAASLDLGPTRPPLPEGFVLVLLLLVFFRGAANRIHRVLLCRPYASLDEQSQSPSSALSSWLSKLCKKWVFRFESESGAVCRKLSTGLLSPDETSVSEQTSSTP